MTKFIIRLLVNGAVIFGIAYFSGGALISVDSFGWAVVAALVLGLVNALVKPIVSLLSLPVTVLTLGLFTLVINGLMLMLVSWIMGSHFVVAGFWQAIVAALLISILSSALSKLVSEKDE